jgi:hypothetical protein
VTERNGSAELRTILQNVEVLRVNPQLEPSGNNRVLVPIASLLVPAQYADLVALADTGARLRITLRNPLDDAIAPRHSLGLATIFSGNSGAEPQNESKTAPKASAGLNPGGSSSEHAIQLNVQVLGASLEALGQLDANLAAPDGHDWMRVAAFRKGADADELIRKLEQARELELVSSSVLTASAGRPVSVHASAAPYRLRVQFSSSAGPAGKVNLRVEPEISLREGPGVETHRYDADLPDGGSFLVRGLLGHAHDSEPNDARILTRLFPGHTWGGRELVIFVTARPGGPLSPSAVAQTGGRGR